MLKGQVSTEGHVIAVVFIMKENYVLQHVVAL